MKIRPYNQNTFLSLNKLQHWLEWFCWSFHLSIYLITIFDLYPFRSIITWSRILLNIKNTDLLSVQTVWGFFLSNISIYFISDQWWMRGSLCLNVLISVGGVENSPLICSLHIFQVQNWFLLQLSVNQTIPIFSVSRSFSNLTSAPPFPSRNPSFINSVAPFDLGLGLQALVFHTNPSVVEDLLIGSTTHSVFLSQTDWCGPPGPNISYAAPVPSSPTAHTTRDPSLSIQRFYQDFKFPNYPLDTFSNKLFDVTSSTVFVDGDTQTQLCYAITRLFFFILFMYIWAFCKDILYLEY